MLLNRFHPAVRLLAWMGLVVTGQMLEGAGLTAALLAGLGASAVLAPGHLRRLLRRARFLLLTIGLLFVCGTPGEALVPWLGSLSPTAEGLGLALLHGGRLVLVLALLALLLEFTTPEALVAGVYGLLKLFPGMPRERVALRLMLVLQYAEEQKGEGRQRTWRDWLDWLECHDDGDTAGAPIRLHAAPLSGVDVLLLLPLAALLAAFLLH